MVSSEKPEDLVSFLDGAESEAELDTRKLVAQANRKKKKSGGFQSMGRHVGLYWWFLPIVMWLLAYMPTVLKMLCLGIGT